MAITAEERVGITKLFAALKNDKVARDMMRRAFDEWDLEEMKNQPGVITAS